MWDGERGIEKGGNNGKGVMKLVERKRGWKVIERTEVTLRESERTVVTLGESERTVVTLRESERPEVTLRESERSCFAHLLCHHLCCPKFCLIKMEFKLGFSLLANECDYNPLAPGE